MLVKLTNDIPVVSEELMKQVDRILYHGGQRAKSHDLRFGQWLVNKIRIKYADDPSGMSGEQVTRILFSLENPELLEILEGYND